MNLNNKDCIYRPSSFPFKNFTHYIKNLECKYNHLPEAFINRDVNDIIENSPEVNFEINQSKMDGDVFRTNFFVRINLNVKCRDKSTSEEKSYNLYTLALEIEAFTHIENSSNVPEIEIKKILMVDVSYLIFPFIRFEILKLTESMKATPVLLNPIEFEKLLEAQLQSDKVDNCNSDSKPANS